MLVDAALTFCNRILTQEDWARGRLKPHAGLNARLNAGAFSIFCTITAHGFLRRAQPDAEADVQIDLPGDQLWRLSEGRDALLSIARISGRADLADTLGFLLRNLRLDLAAELSPWIGDIFAARLAKGLGALATAHVRSIDALARNWVEHLRDETRALPSRPEADRHRTATGDLALTADALERRIARLEAQQSRA